MLRGCVSALAALLLGGMGCMPTFPHRARATASLRLHGKPADATVTIDEERVGPLAVVEARGVALPEGTHQVTVEAPGYFPWDRLVESKPGAEKKVDITVELIPIPE